MTVQIFRPGRAIVIPGIGLQVGSVRSSAAASNWWDVPGQTCVAAYAAKGAADLAASYVNLANPGTNNASPGVAPTFSAADGWTFNGSTQYLTTGIVPGLAYSMIIRLSDGLGTATGQATAGLYDYSTRCFLIMPHGGSAGTYEFWNGGQLVVGGGQKNAGVLAIAGKGAYLDGASVGTIPAGGNPPVSGIFIGGTSFNNGTLINQFGHKIQAMAIYSGTLTSGEVASLTTKMNVL
jgi:hypothetical protein